MFGSANNGAKAYAQVDMETGVAAASPHKLVVMLFEGAIMAISAAMQRMQAGDIAGKGKSISKAITIIDEGLRASLAKEVGGEVALNLDALYEYMSDRLIVANLKNQPQILEEVHQLLKGLKDAWEAIAPVQNDLQQPPLQQPAPAVGRAGYDSLAPQPASRLMKA
jgi:flagellar protein FliS